MKYENLANEIVEKIGGNENVSSVMHCATRLRFVLNNEGIADTDSLKKMDGILSVVQAGGQYQIIIGNHVPDVFKAVEKALNGKQSDSPKVQAEAVKEKKIITKLLDTIMGIMVPLIGVMAATGIIKGFLALFVSMGWLNQESGSYTVLYAIADVMFYFFPIFVGYTAAKKFKMNELVGMAIGAVLLYPTITSLVQGDPSGTLFKGTIFESSIYTEFFGIPLILTNYSATIIPAILAVFVASKIESVIKKFVPNGLSTFGVPMVTLLIAVPITFVIIGPLSVVVSEALGSLIIGTYDLSPGIISAIVGGLWIPMVIFGVHGAIVPIAFTNFFTMGYDVILPMITGHGFAAAGAVLAIALKTKDKKKRGLGISASFSSGVVGVSEPAIYGFLLLHKKILGLVCLISAVGGGVIGFTGTRLLQITGQGIFAAPSFIEAGGSGVPKGLIVIVLVMVLSFVIAFLVTFLFYREKEVNVQQEQVLSNQLNK
ncbi:PTS transporter subunit EIIC [Metabacillus niabensis]|uniref:PTS transporter subunit EIIC n=1 Tax=Metabacillus niabensis TaxID=324854 RepID=UPI0039A356EB